MNKLLLSLLLLSFSVFSNAQSVKKQVAKKQTFKTGGNSKSSKSSLQETLNGQWRGFFNSKGDIVASGADNTEYVLELDIQGANVSGFSYSYFQNRSYYVICSLSGTFDKATKTLTVVETAKVKSQTPPNWDDCLQMHVLTYKKEDNTEVLTGRWKMAPGQIGDCGFGNTTLTRKTLSKNLASYNHSKNNTAFSAPKATLKKPTLTNHNKTTPPLAKVNSKPQQQPAETQPVTSLPSTKDITEVPAPEKPAEQPVPLSSDINLENRNNDLLQTVKIQNATVQVDLYDNGVVDGDSISLFYNSKLILSHQRLSEKAITLTLNVNTGKAINELTMYAENLGEIPPNTALMVVTDGDNRYEVPITSDLKTSGTIRFVYAGKK